MPRTCLHGPVRDRLEFYSVAEPNTGCWLWSGAVDKNGYGKMTVNRRDTRAHRESYSEHVGPIPDGMQVCHSCDTPSCINPAHLFLGTPQDNMTDRDRKGRHVRLPGESNGAAKLTAPLVAEIRHAAGSYREIAHAFGISPSNVGYIRRGEHWKHV